MRALLDVNLLIALLDRQHVHHDGAHAWWAANQSHGWASSPITQNGMLRVLTQPRYPNPLKFVDAHALLRQQLADANHEFWPDDVSVLDVARFDHTRILGPGQLTDVYLLALAVSKGGRLVTLDESIPLAAVRGAEPRHLAALTLDGSS